MTTEEIKLTTYSKGAGCGCKISPSVLKEILHSEDVFPKDERLIVGNESNDDASVFDLPGDSYLINTTDFFMPVVDDPYGFGKIAATNSLSDIYAMGGSPITALAILGWPIDKLSPQIASRVLEGARFMCRMAGITLAGGHSIESAEPIFGLAVTGLVAKKNLKRNSSAQVGDKIFITKPLGAGIITTAAKRGAVQENHLQECIGYMSTLNKIGERLGEMEGVNALTDITGFGLAGHLIEMCQGSNVSAEINFESVPRYPFLKSYLDAFIYPDMTMKNFSFYSGEMSKLSAEQLFLMCDPQTSGGLLVAVSKNSVDEYLQLVRDQGLQGIADQCIGEMVESGEKRIQVK